MTIKTRVLKYSLYIEGVKVPAQNIQLNNICGQGCTLTASIPPHPSCYVLKRGMYVQLFKSVNDETGVLRFSGILVNKVYSKSGNGRDLRIECASPEIRLSSMKVSEIDSSKLGMISVIDLKGIEKTFDMLEGITYDNEYQLVHALANNKELLKGAFDLTQNGKKGLVSLADDIESKKVTEADVQKNFKALSDIQKKYKELSSRQLNNNDIAQGNAKFKDSYVQMHNAAGKYRKFLSEQEKAQSDLDACKREITAAEKDKDKNKTSLEDLEKSKKYFEKTLLDKTAELKKLSSTFSENAKNLGNEFIGNMDIDTYVKYNESSIFYTELGEVQKQRKKSGKANVVPDVTTMSNVGISDISQVSSTYAHTMWTERMQETSIISTASDNGKIPVGSDESWTQISRPTFARLFTMFAAEEKFDYFEAFIRLIVHFYSLSNDHRVQAEAKHFNIYDKDEAKRGDCFYSFGIINSDSFKESETGFETQAETAQRFKPIAKLLADSINQTIHSNAGGVPIMSVIQQVLGTMMARYSVIHTQFDKSIVIHPIMCNYFPPCRNVIFPGMISSIQYNANDWATPTRTYMVYQSYLKPYEMQTAFTLSRQLPQTVAVAPKEARQLQNINYRVLKDTLNQEDFLDKKDGEKISDEQNQQFQKSLKSKVDGYNAVNSYNTKEEEDIGRSTNFVSFGLGYMIKSPSYSQTRMADMYHGMAKYSCRSCMVNGGDELDNLVVGMPVIVLDHVYSIYGIVESISVTVMGEGNVQSSVVISMPRMPLHSEYDVLTHAGLWFDTVNSYPDNIGNYYSELLGNWDGDDQSFFKKCKSFTDPLVDESAMVNKEDMDDDTVLLKMCIARLNNAYIDSHDKEEFIKSFRKVEEETEEGDNWLKLKADCPRANRVKEYLAALELDKDDDGYNKYSRVLPDSMSYETLGHIAINVEAPALTEEEAKLEAEAGDTLSGFREIAKKTDLSQVSDKNGLFTSAVSDNTGKLTSEEIEQVKNNMNGLAEHSLDQTPLRGGKLTSKFGYRNLDLEGASHYHGGIDIGCGGDDYIGRDIMSIADGRVVAAGYQAGGWGNYIKIDHGNGYQSIYAHCLSGSKQVKVGEYVKKGQSIAGMGKSGLPNMTAHCHLEIRKNNERLNPEKFFKEGTIPHKKGV